MMSVFVVWFVFVLVKFEMNDVLILVLDGWIEMINVVVVDLWGDLNVL